MVTKCKALLRFFYGRINTGCMKKVQGVKVKIRLNPA